jgi:hypothetical protein
VPPGGPRVVGHTRVAGLGGWPPAPARLGLGASTPSKRMLSPAAVRAAAGAFALAPAVRLDLHPADLRHPRLASAGRDLLERLLSQGRRPVTHAALGAAR